MSNSHAPKIFFITGVSSGFGSALAGAALEAGHIVVGTVRHASDAAIFQARVNDRAHAVVLDVTDFDAIDATVQDIQRRVGFIDVLINNAGYGHEGTIEESSIDQLKHQFDVNVFGAAAMIKAVLPSMRERRSGQIINMTSMGGFVTMPGIAWYCGSKFALEGISEVLAKEVEGFGINVTAVAPGSFRTDWAGRSMVRTPRTIHDYDALFDPIRAARQAKSGRQTGDPARAAQALLKIVNDPRPPRHLLLGSDALGLVREKLGELTDSFNTWEQLTISTDHT